MQIQLAIKIGVVFIIAALILVPISMVRSKIHERQLFLDQAKQAVTESWTRPQRLTTPVIAIPYTQSRVRSESGFYKNVEPSQGTKILYIMPEKSQANALVDNRVLHKGIYSIPVYMAKLQISASFSAELLHAKLARLQKTAGVDEIHSPYLALHIADVRGFDSEPLLSINDQRLTVEPGSRLPALAGGIHAPFDESFLTKSDITLSLSMTLRGLESLAFLSLGDTSKLHVESDWPHPEFIGASLPRDRSINEQGFNAEWSRTKFANTNQTLFNRCASEGHCDALLASASGVRFIEPVDIYLQSERSLKYAMLFIALSFVCFFVFEHLKQVRIHPIQYTFVGLAIATFYLLLISMAEHFSFGVAYSVAVTCCCALLLFYVRYMFRSLISALLFSVMIAGLYCLLYVIVQAEDFALLMGSLLVFTALSVVMVVTRHIDWYELGGSEHH